MEETIMLIGVKSWVIMYQLEGWIGCEAGDIFVIKEINKKFLWNYSNYVFYGADIREYYSDFIKEQLIAIAESNHEIEGHFSVDDDEGAIKQYWNLSDGKLTVVERSDISSSK